MNMCKRIWQGTLLHNPFRLPVKWLSCMRSKRHFGPDRQKRTKVPGLKRFRGFADLDQHKLSRRVWSTNIPRRKTIPSTVAKREYSVIGFLDPTKGNLWKVTHHSMNSRGQSDLAYAHHYSIQSAHAPTKYYSWDHYLEDIENPDLKGITLDPRYHYYDETDRLSAILSEDRFAITDDEKELAKCSEWRLTEMSSVEVSPIPDDSMLGSWGRKRPGTTQEGQTKAPKRGSSFHLILTLLRQRLRRKQKRDSKKPKVRGPIKGPPKLRAGVPKESLSRHHQTVIKQWTRKCPWSHHTR